MSIRTILLAASLVVGMAAFGQSTITEQEYWLDGQFEARQPVSTQVDISGLPVGVHTYSMRVKDSEDRWSAAVTKFFVIPSPIPPATSIIAREYRLDGKVVTRVGSDASPAQIDLVELANGLHVFTIRVRDNNGAWSAPVTKFFIKTEVEPATIARYMYWLDEDEANRVTGELTDSSGVLPVTLPDTLSIGSHTLSWRVGDSRNVWSEVRTEEFYLEEMPADLPSAADLRGRDKVLENGVLYILRGEKIYIVTGQEVK